MVLAVALVILSLFQHHHGWPLWQTLEIPPDKISDGENGVWRFTLPRDADQSHRRAEYRAVLYEDGARLGHDARNAGQIAREGRGLHLVTDNNRLLFSTSDGSDPRENGRRYSLRVPLNVPSGLPRGLAILFGLGTILWLLPTFHRRLPAGLGPLWLRVRPLAGRRLAGRAVFWAILFGTCMAHFTRHNDFPYYYHPDEPKKAFFVTETRAHFNHPQLLTAGTRLLAWMTGANECPQMAVERGRAVSAFFASMTVVMLGAAAWRLGGALAAGVAIPLLFFHPDLYEAAKYMKEDTALLAGIASSIFASVLFAEKPERWRALFLGLAAGLAVSGKYIGILIPPLVMLLVLFTPKDALGPRTRPLLLMNAFAAMAAITTVINFDAIRQFPEWKYDFGREVDTFGPGKREEAISVPHLYFLRTLAGTVPITLLVLGAVQGFQILRGGGSERRRWLVPVLFLFGYLGALSFSIYTYDRYALPADILLVWFGACGAGTIARLTYFQQWRERPWPKRALLALTGWTLFLLAPLVRYVPATRTVNRCLQNDTRAQLYRFIRDHLPKDAVIAQHGTIRLPFQDKGLPAGFEALPQRVLSEIQLESFGDMEALRAKGTTHVAFQPGEWPKSWPAVFQDGQFDAPPGNGIDRIVWRSQAPYGTMVATEVLLLELAPAEGS
jgi:hypothetical protein